MTGRRIRLISYAGIAAVLLCAAACSKKAPPGIDRLAILPVENLSGKPAFDGTARLVQTVLVSQISGSPELYVFATDGLGGAYGGRARRAVHAYITERQGVLRLAAAVEDLATHRMVVPREASGPWERQLEIVDALARQLAPQVRPFDTQNAVAWRSYSEGIRKKDAELLDGAIQADANFGTAYVALAQTLLSKGDREGAAGAVRRGLERKQEIAPAERAQLQLMDSMLRQDVRARAEASAALARAVPADPTAATGAAEAAMLARDFRGAVEWYGRTLKLDPENAELWNQLGYADAYAGNLEGARSALLEYGKRSANNPNGFDSLGEVHYAAGDFANAEKYFLEAARMNPGFLNGAPLWKAAHARLMMGDVAGADGIAKKYFELLRKGPDPLVNFQETYWDYVAGRRAQALNRPIESTPGLIHAQRAVWLLDAGERAKAREEARLGLADVRFPPLRAFGVLASYLSEPPATVQEWKTRAAQRFPGAVDEATQPLATAYALVLSKQFREAIPLLEESIARTPPTGDAQLRFALGWALTEEGRFAEAARHIAQFPVPQGGVEIFGSLVIPRILQLQATVLERQGKSSEAAKKLEIYRKLGGR
jgi:tetratricopeptide (TPR) repeat protein